MSGPSIRQENTMGSINPGTQFQSHDRFGEEAGIDLAGDDRNSVGRNFLNSPRIPFSTHNLTHKM
jgi:hypothetical protein